jgi:adenine-specific DNA-methyltransferase
MISAALEQRQALGQFLTPPQIADFMASLFERRPHELKVLDPGAGTGELSVALIRKFCRASVRPHRIFVTAYEVDSRLIPALERNYADCEAACLQAGISFSTEIFNRDFIEAALPLFQTDLFSVARKPFNAVILNPPYRKIQSGSAARCLLRSAGIETSNLYSGFLALAARLLSKDGELVAITPRSFCNGPYFKSFRQEFLSKMSLRRLHLLDSRSAAFRDDNVLQENVILHAVKSETKPERVIVSASPGIPCDDLVERSQIYSEIVSPSDPEQFIHLVTDDVQEDARRSIHKLSTSLRQLGLEVSTGRVVEFRAREFLVYNASENSLPLIYPRHFSEGFVRWPAEKNRKPDAIKDIEATQELLVQSGIYVLVKRFTSKEERRRVVACVYDPRYVSSAKVGFENHLNYFHARGKALSMKLAKGLAAYLNSTIVDCYFRQFNGHTQVNAADLRSLRYPTQEQLNQLGSRIPEQFPPQAALDEFITAMTS